MIEPSELLQKNKEWAKSKLMSDPGYFERSAAVQKPNYLWVGCSDSRVPAEYIIDVEPGELFVHRNIGNQIFHTDINCMSVVQFAVEVLQVEHIIVCGHHGCAAVQFAMENGRMGLVDNWLVNIKENYSNHQHEVDAAEDSDASLNRMCELNVIEQVYQLAHNPFIQDAWSQGCSLTVHGWIYSLNSGLITDLDVDVSAPEDIEMLMSGR